MILFYIDETGDQGLSQESLQNFEWFILGAMGIPDCQRLELMTHILELKRMTWRGRFSDYLSKDPTLKWKWVGTDKHWALFEIKGARIADAIRRRDMGETPRDLAYQWLSYQELQRLRQKMVVTLGKFKPTLYFIAVHKPTLLRERDALLNGGRITPDVAKQVFRPVPIAYTLLQQRAALLIDHVYGDSEGALFLPDEQKGHESDYPNFKLARDQFAEQVWRNPDYRLIIDKPLWVRTRELEVDREIVQLIDFCLYSVRRAFATMSWNSAWFRDLESNLARHWTTGSWWNAGVTLYPRRAPKPQ